VSERASGSGLGAQARLLEERLDLFADNSVGLSQELLVFQGNGGSKCRPCLIAFTKGFLATSELPDIQIRRKNKREKRTKKKKKRKRQEYKKKKGKKS